MAAPNTNLVLICKVKTVSSGQTAPVKGRGTAVLQPGTETITQRIVFVREKKEKDGQALKLNNDRFCCCLITLNPVIESSQKPTLRSGAGKRKSSLRHSYADKNLCFPIR